MGDDGEVTASGLSYIALEEVEKLFGDENEITYEFGEKRIFIAWRERDGLCLYRYALKSRKEDRALRTDTYYGILTKEQFRSEVLRILNLDG